MPDIPASDGDFSGYAIAAVNYILANNAGKWDFPAPQTTALSDSNTNWLSALLAHQTAQQTAHTMRQAKDDARKLKPSGLEVLLRLILQQIASHPNTTNADRAALGLPDPDNPPSPPPPLTSHPDPHVEQIDRLRLTLGWVDSASGKKAKPAGVKEAEIAMAITAQGAMPPPVDQFVHIGTAARTPHTEDFEPEDAGKVAHFILRWVKTDDTTSAWCPTMSVTIVG